jgi:hypothetical protein
MIPDIKNFYLRIGDLEGMEILIKAEEWANGLTEDSWIDAETNMLDNAYFDHAKASRGLVEFYIRANPSLFVRNEHGKEFPIVESRKIH